MNSEPHRGPLVDARGTRCPHPVIELARAAAAAPPGTRVVLLADDPVAATDVPAWCRMSGADLVSVEQEDDYRRFVVTTRRSDRR